MLMERSIRKQLSAAWQVHPCVCVCDGGEREREDDGWIKAGRQAGRHRQEGQATRQRMACSLCSDKAFLTHYSILTYAPTHTTHIYTYTPTPTHIRIRCIHIHTHTHTHTPARDTRSAPPTQSFLPSLPTQMHTLSTPPYAMLCSNIILCDDCSVSHTAHPRQDRGPIITKRRHEPTNELPRLTDRHDTHKDTQTDRQTD